MSDDGEPAGPAARRRPEWTGPVVLVAALVLGALAGLRVGAIITSVDGHPVQFADALTVLTPTRSAADQVTVDHERAGVPATAVMSLREP